MSDKGALPKNGTLSLKSESSRENIVGSSSKELQSKHSQDSGFELKSTPKVLNIPQAGVKEEPMSKVDSCKLRNSQDVDVFYKSKMQDSSLSVLYVGSASTLKSKIKDYDSN